MATPDQKNATVLSEQAIALAEELGRIAGTIEGTAESWLNRQSLAEQLTRVRDGAAEMLESLTAGAERGRAAATGSVQTIAADVRRKASQALAAASAGRAAQKAKKGSKKTKPATAQAAQRPDPSRAPGKQRRKPAPTMRGLKKSDERIPKLRTATAVRQRRKLHA
jgi:hypothetical protein